MLLKKHNDLEQVCQEINHQSKLDCISPMELKKKNALQSTANSTPGKHSPRLCDQVPANYIYNNSNNSNLSNNNNNKGLQLLNKFNQLNSRTVDVH